MRRVLLLVAALIAPLPAFAQIDRGVIDAMVGPWTLLPTDGRPGCQIELAPDSIGDGMRAVPGASCKLTIPAAAKVSSWKLDDGDTLLVDAKGVAQIRFVEDETALLSSPDLIAPKYYLIPRIPGYDHLPPASELVGTWHIGQRKNHACQITLGPLTRASKGKGGSVKASPSCGAGSLPAKLEHWSREDLKILLWGPADLLLAFEPIGKMAYLADSGRWNLSR